MSVVHGEHQSVGPEGSLWLSPSTRPTIPTEDQIVATGFQSRPLLSLKLTTIPPSVQLADQVLIEAQRAAGTELMKHAGSIFDTLAVEARRVVGIFAALPEAPKGMRTAGDPPSLLTRAAGHEATTARFWRPMIGLGP